MTAKHHRAAPTTVDRDEFERQLGQQVAVEKELTRFGGCHRADDGCR